MATARAGIAPPAGRRDRLEHLHALACALSAALSADEVAAAIVTHGMVATDASCGVLGLPEGAALVLSHRHRFGDADAAPPRLPLGAQAPMPAAMRAGEPVLLRSRAEWLERYPATPPRSDFEAFAAVPLMGEHGAVGCLGFGFPSARVFAEADVELLRVVARQGAQALERAALYEDRAHVARALQRGLLPTALPPVPGLQVAAAYQPQDRGHEVGGDFYDVFENEQGWCAAIGDVCGKGVEAAVVTGMVRHTLRALELGHGDPGAVLRRLNTAVARHAPESRFCSAALAHFTVRDGEVAADLAVAGHPPPFIVRAGGEVEEIDVRGDLLGIAEVMRLNTTRCRLRSGDALVLYTDGVVEARARGELFGYTRLRTALAQHAGADAHRLVTAVQDAVRAFARGPVGDDQALLVLRAD